MPESLLGVGLYTIPQAARLLRLSSQKLRRWADGYLFLSDGARRRSEPLIHRDLQEREDEVILTFQDLLELHMVRFFRSEGVSIQTIRKAAEQATLLYKTTHPFTVKGFETDGKSIFATLEEQGVEGISKAELLQDLIRSQMVMESIARPFFRQIEFEEMEPSRWFPNGKGGGIVIDPQRSFGKPIEKVSGIPTETLYNMARGGEKIENIAHWYKIDVETVHEAVRYENSLLAA